VTVSGDELLEGGLSRGRAAGDVRAGNANAGRRGATDAAAARPHGSGRTTDASGSSRPSPPPGSPDDAANDDVITGGAVRLGGCDPANGIGAVARFSAHAPAADVEESASLVSDTRFGQRENFGNSACSSGALDASTSLGVRGSCTHVELAAGASVNDSGRAASAGVLNDGVPTSSSLGRVVEFDSAAADAAISDTVASAAAPTRVASPDVSGGAAGRAGGCLAGFLDEIDRLDAIELTREVAGACVKPPLDGGALGRLEGGHGGRLADPVGPRATAAAGDVRGGPATDAALDVAHAGCALPITVLAPSTRAALAAASAARTRALSNAATAAGGRFAIFAPGWPPPGREVLSATVPPEAAAAASEGRAPVGGNAAACSGACGTCALGGAG